MLRSVFATLLTIIFSVFFFVTTVIFVLLNTFLNVDFYKGQISSDIHKSISEILPSMIYSSDEAKNPEIAASLPSREKIAQQIMDGVSDKDIENMMVSLVSQITHPNFDDKGIAWVKVDLSFFPQKVPALKYTFADTTLQFHIDKKNGPNFLMTQDFSWNVLYILCAVDLLLLLVIALIIYSPWHRILKWLGKPLMSAAFVTGLIFYLLLEAPMFLLSQNGNFPEGLGNNYVSVRDFASVLVTPISVMAMWVASIVFVVGFVTYMIGFVGKHRSVRKI